MAKAVGLDLGSRYAKAVLLERTARGLTVLGFAMEEVPAGEGAASPDPSWVRQLLLKTGWKAEPIGVAVGARETTLREISVPFTDAEQLSQVVEFEAENYLPFPLEDAAVDFLPLKRTVEGTQVMVFAVRKQTLSDQQQMLEEAGVDPYLMGLEPLALLEALEGTGSLPEEPTLLLDLGASSATVIYLEDARPTYMRVLRLGAELTTGSGATLTGYVEKLSRELRRLLAALPEPARTAPVLVVGGNAGGPVTEALSGSLGLQVESLRLASPGPVQGEISEELERRGLVALGLALPLVGVSRFTLNLRKGEFRYRPKLERLRRPLSLMLAGWMLLLSVCVVGMELRVRNLSHLERRFEEREQSIWDSVAPRREKPSNLLSWLGEERRRLQALSSSGGPGRQLSALETLRAILAAVPPDVEVTVRAVNISPERSRIEMVTNSHTDANKIVKAVNARTPLAASPKNLRYEEGKSRFELEVTPGERPPHAE